MSKNKFMSFVLLNLIVQLFVTFGVMEYARKKGYTLTILYYIIGAILTIITMLIIMMSSYPIYITFLFFCIFSVIWGILLGSETIQLHVSSEAIKRAITGTICIFMSMFLLGIILAYSGYDLSIFGGILFAALSVLLIVEIINLFFPMSDNTYKLKLYFGLFLFSCYTIYDSNIIMNKTEIFKGDFIKASMGLYLDFLNIFSRMLSVNNN
jgi:FtsH-binding integral membrane protein